MWLQRREAERQTEHLRRSHGCLVETGPSSWIPRPLARLAPGFKLSGLATRWSGFRLQPSKSANTCTRRPGAASSALLRLPNWSPHQQIYLEVQLWAIRIGVHLGLSQPTLPPNLGDTAVPSLRTGCRVSHQPLAVSAQPCNGVGIWPAFTVSQLQDFGAL